MDVQEAYVLNTEQIFTVFLVMLGPLRLLGPFVMATNDLIKYQRIKLAFQSALIALTALIAAGFIGRHLLHKWDVSPVFLLLAAGIVFFLSALPPLLTHNAESVVRQDHMTRPVDVALQLVITPYGTASIIVLLSAGHDLQRNLTIIGCAAAVMMINIIAMIFGHTILKTIGTLPLKILGTSLGTMQLALSLKIIFTSFKLMLE